MRAFNVAFFLIIAAALIYRASYRDPILKHAQEPLPPTAGSDCYVYYSNFEGEVDSSLSWSHRHALTSGDGRSGPVSCVKQRLILQLLGRYPRDGRDEMFARLVDAGGLRDYAPAADATPQRHRSRHKPRLTQPIHHDPN